MSTKNSSTTADYLEWSDAINLIQELAKDNNFKMSLLVAIGCFTGLKISDILALRWEQIYKTPECSIIERKTEKQRTIHLNTKLQNIIINCYNNIKPLDIKQHILTSQKETVFSVQQINIIFKKIRKQYKLQIKNFSSESLRKTFGRQFYRMNSKNPELALAKLMELFNHPSVAITKQYLNIKKEYSAPMIVFLSKI